MGAQMEDQGPLCSPGLNVGNTTTRLCLGFIDFLFILILQLNKKRSSFVGAFVSTHGRSIDDVDKSILEAKTALSEVTKDLTERSQRWRQVPIIQAFFLTSLGDT